MNYDRVTRWLHAGIVLSVAVQLLTSGLMRVPKPGRMITASELSFFKIHEWFGIIALTLLTVHWLWGLSGRAATQRVHLFPWFSRERMGNVVADLKSLPRLIRGGFSGQTDQGTAITGAVHGLGLLTATGMALTGLVIFFGMRSDGAMSGSVHFVKEFHEFLSNFLWAFLAGHVGMAILHHLQGDRVLTRMFNPIQK